MEVVLVCFQDYKSTSGTVERVDASRIKPHTSVRSDGKSKRWFHLTGVMSAVFSEMHIWNGGIWGGYIQGAFRLLKCGYEFMVEFLCTAIFYIVLHFLPGTEQIYPIQSMTTLSPTWFNFAFRLPTWVEFGLILLLSSSCPWWERPVRPWLSLALWCCSINYWKTV